MLLRKITFDKRNIDPLPLVGNPRTFRREKSTEFLSQQILECEKSHQRKSARTWLEHCLSLTTTRWKLRRRITYSSIKRSVAVHPVATRSPGNASRMSSTSGTDTEANCGLVARTPSKKTPVITSSRHEVPNTKKGNSLHNHREKWQRPTQMLRRLVSSSSNCDRTTESKTDRQTDTRTLFSL